MSEPRTAVLADDHPLVRDSLRRVVGAALPGVEVLEAGSWPESLRLMASPAVAMALVDLHMPGLDAFEGLRRLRTLRPDVALVVVSGDSSPSVVRDALALGARGFIPKSDPPEVFRHAVALVWAGGTCIPRVALAAARSVARAAPTPPALSVATGLQAGPDALQGELSALTPRQLEVLACLARGMPNKLIAHELKVSEGTAKIHLAAIMRVLRVRNRTEAVVRARELGFEGQRPPR